MAVDIDMNTMMAKGIDLDLSARIIDPVVTPWLSSLAMR